MSYSFVNGFPFTAWGESVFLALQTLVFGMLAFFYTGHGRTAIGYLLVYLGVVRVLCSEATPVEVLWIMQGFSVLILLVRKLYLYENMLQLSAATLFMLFVSLVRIFTSVQETGDPIVIFTHIASTFTSMVQLLYY